MQKTISEWVRDTAKGLIRIAASKDAAHLEAEELAALAICVERSWLVSHADTILSPNAQKKMDALAKRRKRHEPLAYILGNQPFLGRPFLVNRHVLIPRLETEELAQRLLEQLPKKTKHALVCDIGTGSGAIAITIAAERPDLTVLATDVSTQALATAKENAKRIKTKNIVFLKTPLFSPALQKEIEKRKPLHLFLAANLPYLPDSDKKKLAKDVVDFEPEKALFAGKDGTELIERFLRQIAGWRFRHSREDGNPVETKVWTPASAGVTILCEFDPPQAKKLLALAKDLFPNANARIVKDQCGRERFLEIKNTSS